jgi:hypothetical protein
MAQRGQVFPLNSADVQNAYWAYRYRVGGRECRRVKRGGFASKLAAEQALERLRQEHGLVEAPTLGEFVEMYFAQPTLSQRRSTSCAGC